MCAVIIHLQNISSELRDTSMLCQTPFSCERHRQMNVCYFVPGVTQNFILSCLTKGLFAEAQAYVLDKMERDMHPKFLRSTDGQQFLEALVKRDINRRKKKR